MISKEKLREILRQSEGSKLEFKKSFHFTERIGQSMCAFANSGGGLIIFGAEAKESEVHITGIQNKDEAHQKLAGVFPLLDPRPKYSMEDHILEGKTLMIMDIAALPISDVCFFKKSVFVRQGSVNIEINKKELIEFLRARGVISFEENHSSARIADLDENKIRKHIKNKGIPVKKIEGIGLETLLASLSVANQIGKFYIKNVGTLFFAKEILRFFSNSELRIVKYKGEVPELKNREYDERINDTTLEVLEKSFQKVNDKAGITARIVDGKRVEAPMIPNRVLREALTNAVSHRDYFDPNGILIEIFDDRIQITNPGTLLPGQTLKNFAELRRHRNPILHRLINDAGWGEGLNLGVKDMIRIMRQNDLADPVFDDLGGFFRVTLYSSLSNRAVKPYGVITERQKKALAYLEKHESITAPVFAKLVGISHPTAIRDLNEMVAQGLLKKIGQYRSSKYIKERKNIKI
jgi:ATP-dependent DNA helicase RecG